jgi:peptidoglycan/LPS O-acetylase OafA/YrhL
VVMFAAPIARLTFWHYGLRDIDEYFPAVADSIAAGCLLACYYPEIQRKMAWATRPVPFIALAILALATPFLLFRVRLGILFGGVAPLIIALCIFAAIERRDWILNNRFTAIGGALSYSLYLWQQPFLNRNSAHWWTAFPVNIGLALLCAVASYGLVEKPFLRLSHKPKARVPALATF